MFFRLYLTLIATIAVAAQAAFANGGTWSSRGEAAGEARVFTDDGRDETEDAGLGMFTRLEAGYRKGRLRFRVRGFARVDRLDDSRDIAAFEEAWLDYRAGVWQARAGFQLLNWTATEAFHPADIINSRNLDSNIESPEKLGELMFSLRRRVGQGGLTVYYMPRFEEPRLPGATSRLSFAPPGFDIGDALRLEGDRLTDDRDETQWGLRFTQVVGNADLSLHYLDHVDRQFPAIAVDPEGGELRPVYLGVQDWGLTYLHILGGWIFKLEAAYKDFEETTNPELALPDHSQAAFGLEYGWVYAGGAEGTAIVEGQNLFGLEEEERAAVSVFQRDFLIGYRHAWNDILGRELLITAIFDAERGREFLINANYKQRLSDTWSVETGLRWIEAPPDDFPPVGLELLDESNQLYLTLSRFF